MRGKKYPEMIYQFFEHPSKKCEFPLEYVEFHEPPTGYIAQMLEKERKMLEKERKMKKMRSGKN